MSEGEDAGPSGFSRQGWGVVAAVWLLAAAAWTPAAHLGGQPQENSFAALASVFLQMLVHFAPWALAMPLFLRLSRRFPIGLGRSLRSILVFALLGVAVVPLFTAVGVAAGRLLGAAVGAFGAEVFAGFGRATLVTALFALPTYVAIVAIGQTVAYFERYRERERLLSRSRSEALRAQIAPHFLFNALNAISALGYSDPAQADRAMVRLAGLLRETLDRPEWTSLGEEIALVADYVELHRLLLGERLRFELSVAPDAWEARVPAMLLQPLVENALVHGLSRLPEGGALHIRAKRADGAVEIELVNDAPSAAAKPAPEGIGLVNVRRRLAAAYGDGGQFDFERSGGRARAAVRIPFEAQPQ